MTLKSALFIAYSAPDVGVFESQVLEYGQFIRSLGLDFRYCIFEGLRTGLQRRKSIDRYLAKLQKRFDAHIEMHYVPSPLSRPGMWLSATIVRCRGRHELEPGLVIQARGAAATCVAFGVRRRIASARVIFDARGDEAAESRLEATQALDEPSRRWWMSRALLMEKLERRAALDADHVLAVSGPLKARLCAMSGIPPERVTVVPCCVNPERVVHNLSTRRMTRARLRFEDKFVLVYSGSLGPYQIPDRVAALVEAIRERMGRTHLLVLTRDGPGAARWFRSLDEAGGVTVVDAPYDEVGGYLAAADAALLLRQDDPVNRDACPVKFGEYVVAGLPVIVTPRIGDVSAYIQESGHGVVIDIEGSVLEQAQRVVEAINSGRWQDRNIIRSHALRVFAREAYRSDYENILRAGRQSSTW